MTVSDWPFEDPPNVAAITTRAIIHDGDWIGLVSHDLEDGGWQFLGLRGASDTEEAMVVALHRVLEMDPSIAQVADLPLGWRAWRQTADGPWERAPDDN